MLLLRYCLAFIALIFTFAAHGQSKLNQRLKRELDSIGVEDQKYRIILMAPMVNGASPKLDSVAKAAMIPADQVGEYVSQRMVAIDSLNIKRIGQLIRQVGYPGKSMVGTPTNEVALDVIQHSTRIPQYLPLVKKAASQGEIPFYLYARMLDRQLMHEGKEQLYGTQGCSYGVLNTKTGQRETVSFIWPIQDAAHVNERRKKAGFDSTVEANAKRLNIEYKPTTLAEAYRIEQAAKASQP
ncbi:DUF6624 domain-containing protein [Hymenobacter sp. HD11105]|jgi:hypothetical protein